MSQFFMITVSAHGKVLVGPFEDEAHSEEYARHHDVKYERMLLATKPEDYIDIQARQRGRHLWVSCVMDGLTEQGLEDWLADNAHLYKGTSDS